MHLQRRCSTIRDAAFTFEANAVLAPIAARTNRLDLAAMMARSVGLARGHTWGKRKPASSKATPGVPQNGPARRAPAGS